MKKLPDIFIIRDTREKENHGWNFDCEIKKPGKIRIAGTIDTCLDSADYSIVGLEDIVRIERKNGFSELFGNMIPSENKERFEREMERMAHIPHKYIIVESVLDADSLRLSVPQMKYSPPCHAVLSWLIDIEIQYNVSIIFAGTAGKHYARLIFENIARRYHESIRPPE